MELHPLELSFRDCFTVHKLTLGRRGGSVGGLALTVRSRGWVGPSSQTFFGKVYITSGFKFNFSFWCPPSIQLL